MALVKGTNSYVTVEEADAYLEDRAQEADWLALSVTVRDQALVTAARIMDTLPWVGYAISESQNMAWPRNATVYDSALGRSVIFDSTDTAPVKVQRAQIELGFHIGLNTGVTVSSTEVFGVNAGGVEAAIIRKPSRLPVNVLDYIKDYITEAGNSPMRVG